mmetsp:Transcript_25121/g.57716  ORF Transcript_25121/g.57716 Transcript_25121/m.57716 type:complete len:249 (+) Transcript_25121:1598-2344(+)
MDRMLYRIIRGNRFDISLATGRSTSCCRSNSTTPFSNSIKISSSSQIQAGNWATSSAVRGNSLDNWFSHKVGSSFSTSNTSSKRSSFTCGSLSSAPSGFSVSSPIASKSPSSSIISSSPPPTAAAAVGGAAGIDGCASSASESRTMEMGLATSRSVPAGNACFATNPWPLEGVSLISMYCSSVGMCCQSSGMDKSGYSVESVPSAMFFTNLRAANKRFSMLGSFGGNYLLDRACPRAICLPSKWDDPG